MIIKDRCTFVVEECTTGPVDLPKHVIDQINPGRDLSERETKYWDRQQMLSKESLGTISDGMGVVSPNVPYVNAEDIYPGSNCFELMTFPSRKSFLEQGMVSNLREMCGFLGEERLEKFGSAVAEGWRMRSNGQLFNGSRKLERRIAVNGGRYQSLEPEILHMRFGVNAKKGPKEVSCLSVEERWFYQNHGEEVFLVEQLVSGLTTIPNVGDFINLNGEASLVRAAAIVDLPLIGNDLSSIIQRPGFFNMWAEIDKMAGETSKNLERPAWATVWHQVEGSLPLLSLSIHNVRPEESNSRHAGGWAETIMELIKREIPVTDLRTQEWLKQINSYGSVMGIGGNA